MEFILNQDIVPATLDEAVEVFIDGLCPEMRRSFAELDFQGLLSIAYSRVRQVLIGYWSLDDSSTRLVQWFANNMETETVDEIILLVISSVWRELRKTSTKELQSLGN